jgi:nucleoside 2-deoxyribosyltransferase
MLIMKIYLASPFFKPEEIAVVDLAEKTLRQKGLDVWSPRENEARDAGEFGSPSWAKATFKMDFNAISECDVMVVLYHGNYSDSGTAWECGAAYALKKPVVLVHVHDDNSNIMMHVSAHANVQGIHGLSEYDFDSLLPISYEGSMI